MNICEAKNHRNGLNSSTFDSDKIWIESHLAKMLFFLSFLCIRHTSTVERVPKAFDINSNNGDSWVIESSIPNTVYSIYSNPSKRNSYRFTDGGISTSYPNFNQYLTIFYAKEAASSLEFGNLVTGSHRVVAIGLGDSCPSGTYVTNSNSNSAAESMVNCPMGGKCCFFLTGSPFKGIIYTFTGDQATTTIKILETVNKTQTYPSSSTNVYKMTYTKDDYDNPMMIYLEYEMNQSPRVKVDEYVKGNVYGPGADFSARIGKLYPTPIPIPEQTPRKTEKKKVEVPLPAIIAPVSIVGMLIIIAICFICFFRKIKKMQVGTNSKSSSSSSSSSSNNGKKKPQLYDDNGELNIHYNQNQLPNHPSISPVPQPYVAPAPQPIIYADNPYQEASNAIYQDPNVTLYPPPPV